MSNNIEKWAKDHLMNNGKCPHCGKWIRSSQAMCEKCYKKIFPKKVARVRE